MSTTTFAAVSAVKQQSETQFRADLSPAWTIGGRPNGGYLLAVVARAATVVSGHPDVLAASAHYLRSPEPGPAEVEVEVLRTGRTASQLRGRLLKDGVPQVETLLTMGVLGDAEPHWQEGVPRPEFGEFPEQPWGPGAAASGFPIAIQNEIDVRFDRPLTDGPSGRGELRGLLSLPADEPFDPISLLFALDALPPATLDVAPSGWVPTLELTGYIRSRPAPGPVKVLHRAHLIGDGRVDESCHVWDSEGTLVAHGTQLAGIRLG
ncbi:thioesterase family protein [Amycolatopsis benzoatilytica]|uniref:thioesterase family protein n=1 Tax=Amycolatopsis benzoatilytica TaxID=346045 RepID=UPI00036D2D93|nr:thioesterase family protein [Amycolatopsis benzoatilytica]